MTHAQIDPIFHVTWIKGGETYEAYHMRLAAALLDYQKRIDKGAESVCLDKWDINQGSTYTTLRSYDRAAIDNIDYAFAA